MEKYGSIITMTGSAQQTIRVVEYGIDNNKPGFTYVYRFWYNNTSGANPAVLMNQNIGIQNQLNLTAVNWVEAEL